MNPTTPLTGSHLRTYHTLFQHPVSHNLSWHDVHALFRQIGQVEEQPNGNLKVTRNGQVLVLPPSREKDVSAPEELMALRHFVEQSETAATGAKGGEPHWLLEINHHEARIFRTEMKGSVPQQFLPHDPDDHFRHAHNSKDFSRGLEKPDPNSFFEPVVKALAAGGPILVCGSGTGTGSEMEQFVAWTKHHHPEVARRIVGTVVVDAHHLSDAQLLAKAREFYAKTRTAG